MFLFKDSAIETSHIPVGILTYISPPSSYPIHYLSPLSLFVGIPTFLCNTECITPQTKVFPISTALKTSFSNLDYLIKNI